MLKRLFSIITISLVLSGSFFSVYNIKDPVYADTSTDEWLNVTTNQQLVDAFKYYCKSRDVTIEGSVADAVTSFTTKTFNGIVNTLGIDVNTLQANLKYQTDNNLGTRFLFNSLSIDAYNRIFAQFLQDNELETGDEDINKLVESGEWFTDLDGNGCYVYVFSTTAVDGERYYDGNVPNKAILKYGTPYKYSTSQLVALAGGYASFNITENNKNLNYYIGHYVSSPKDLYYAITEDSAHYIYGVNNPTYVTHRDGHFAICRNNASNPTYYLKLYWQRNNHDVGKYSGLTDVIALNRNDVTTTNSNIYIVSTVINNNTYEGDTIINNNGDTNTYPDTPDIPDPNPNPTPDPPTIPDSGGWQDFSLPEMPNDWLIYGMEKKFPFDIPFNILFALSLLNHEPEIPKFEGDIDLQVCTWHYDIDLTPFDDIATILRKFEVLGFIIGLAILTKNLINWG